MLLNEVGRAHVVLTGERAESIDGKGAANRVAAGICAGRCVRSFRSSTSTATGTRACSPTKRARTSPRCSCATRGRARVEDSIRAGKDTGMRNLPHHACEHSQTWLELSLIAQDLLCWTKLTCLDGELVNADPKRLRHRLLHTAGRSPATAAAPDCDGKPTGPGPRRSPPRSPGCARSHRSADARRG